MVDAVTLGGLRRLSQPTFQNIAIAATKTGNLALFYESVTDNITAFAGGGQTSATALTTEINRITTVATAGDSVKLPATTAVPSSGPGYAVGAQIAGPGATVFIINHGANSMMVFGAGTDTINDVATATGVSQMANSMVLYTCTSAGKWYTEGLATGYSGALQTFSTLNGIQGSTGAAGAGQTESWSASAQLTAMLNRVTGPVTDSARGVSLPPTTAGALPGIDLTVTNAGTGSLNVFTGNTKDVINALSATLPFAIASSKSAQFITYNANQWHTILSN